MPDQNQPKQQTSNSFASPPKSAPKPSPEKDDGLREVHKDGETLRVHPTTVDAHVSAGWQVAPKSA